MQAMLLLAAVFVSGRDVDEAARNSGFFILAEADRGRLTDITVDRADRIVHMTLDDSLTRTAKFYGDQGCVIHPVGEDSVYFTPVPVTTALPDAMSQPWPMGDVTAEEPLPPEIDEAGILAANTRSLSRLLRPLRDTSTKSDSVAKRCRCKDTGKRWIREAFRAQSRKFDGAAALIDFKRAINGTKIRVTQLECLSLCF